MKQIWMAVSVCVCVVYEHFSLNNTFIPHHSTSSQMERLMKKRYLRIANDEIIILLYPLFLAIHLPNH